MYMSVARMQASSCHAHTWHIDYQKTLNLDLQGQVSFLHNIQAQQNLSHFKILLILYQNQSISYIMYIHISNYPCVL
jgi:hypothetical protein